MVGSASLDIQYQMENTANKSFFSKGPYVRPQGVENKSSRPLSCT